MTSSKDLPIPDYDHLLLSDIEHRLKGLDAGSVDRLLEHERAHAARPAAIVLLEQRRAQLREAPGAEPAAGEGPDPTAPRVDQVGQHPSPHQASPQTQGPPQNPPSQGVPTNPAQPRR